MIKTTAIQGRKFTKKTIFALVSVFILAASYPIFTHAQSISIDPCKNMETNCAPYQGDSKAHNFCYQLQQQQCDASKQLDKNMAKNVNTQFNMTGASAPQQSQFGKQQQFNNQQNRRVPQQQTAPTTEQMPSNTIFAPKAPNQQTEQENRTPPTQQNQSPIVY